MSVLNCENVQFMNYLMKDGSYFAIISSSGWQEQCEDCESGLEVLLGA